MSAKNQQLPPFLIQLVDPERLYQHVLALEGNRHPLPDFTDLNAAADYIRNEMQKLHLRVSTHSFSISPYRDQFQNIEGIYHYCTDLEKDDEKDPSSDKKSDPELVYYLTAHYDTVQNCPGAIDNAGSIAIILECARIIVENNIPGSFHFLAFSAEEFNPGWVFFRNQKLRELGLVDDRNRYKNLHISRIMTKYKQLTWRNRQSGLSPFESIQKSIRYLKEFSSFTLTPALKTFFAFDLTQNQPYSHTSIWGNFALVGSEQWVQDHLSQLSEISCVINLDALGYNSSQISSQSQLHASSPKKADTDRSPSDYILADQKFPVQIVANAPAKPHLDSLTELTQKQNSCFQLVPIYLPYDFDQIALQYPDLLRSDHTSFWKRNVPAIFLTDLNDVPNPFYHTPADTIQRIDFDLLGEYTKLILTFLITYTNIQN